MDSERSKTPKVEDAQLDRAAEKGKRVAPYFYPNVLLAVPAAILSKSEGFFEPVFFDFRGACDCRYYFRDRFPVRRRRRRR